MVDLLGEQKMRTMSRSHKNQTVCVIAGFVDAVS